jgi:predicted TPR repeat methyltransferase
MKPAHTRARQAPRRISIDDALRFAIKVHKEGNPREASEHYRAILEASPDHPDALHYLGVALHQTGNREDAFGLLERTLAIAPDYTDARNNLGNMLKEAGRHAEAEAAYRAVIAARPGFVLAHSNLGVVLKAQGRHADAIAAYRKAVELAPDFVQGWINLGNALKAGDDLHGSLSAYRNAIMLSPDNVEAHRNLGRALVAYKRYDEALEVYRQWQQVDPGNPVVAHLIAACAGAETPVRASDDFVQQTFDRFAESFDSVLARLEYRAPGLCGELIGDLLGDPHAQLDVLDAGCGTGLCAPLLRPFARQLEGVDLSAGMLAKAAARASYDRLHEGEMTAWLAAHPGAFDLVVSADTLCYFGALDSVMQAAGGALRAGGLLVFTLEHTADERTAPRFQLHPHGRYSHAEAYVREVLGAAGLDVVEIRYVTLRLEANAKVNGLLVGARRPKH